MIRYFLGKTERVPWEYTAYQLMRTFGWTWEELANTPFDVIAGLIRVVNIEAEVRKVKPKK